MVLTEVEKLKDVPKRTTIIAQNKICDITIYYDAQDKWHDARICLQVVFSSILVLNSLDRIKYNCILSKSRVTN